jgi:hypothetical protein
LNRGAAWGAVTMTNTSAVVPIVGYYDEWEWYKRGRLSRLTDFDGDTSCLFIMEITVKETTKDGDYGSR